MATENLHTKLVEKLVEKKFEYWKEEFIKLLKDDCSFCVMEEDEKFMLKQIKKRAGEKCQTE